MSTSGRRTTPRLDNPSDLQLLHREHFIKKGRLCSLSSQLRMFTEGVPINKGLVGIMRLDINRCIEDLDRQYNLQKARILAQREGVKDGHPK